jgi:hypothetical protein
VKKTAVCQGYAVLFSRLCLEAGVPARYIGGYAGEPHAWNIVKVKGKYYNVDATWDAQLRQANQPYEYFLRSDASFNREHTRDYDFRTKAFFKACPMSSKDGNFHTWSTKYTVDAKPTCTTPGSKSLHCKDWGCTKKKSVTELPALGHNWMTDVDHIYDLGEGRTERYAAKYFCSRCNVLDPVWYFFDKNGSYLGYWSEGLSAQSAPAENRASLPAKLIQLKRSA